MLIGSWCLSVVGGFEFDWWDVAAVLVEAAVVVPVDPFGGRDLDLVDAAPGASGFDQFGLVEPVDRLGQGIVIRGADRADAVADAVGGEAFGERDRGVLGCRGRCGGSPR